MFYRVYDEKLLPVVTASNRIPRMYRGSDAWGALFHHYAVWEENAVFLAESIDDAIALSVAVNGERAAAKYWHTCKNTASFCARTQPDRFKLIRHDPRLFAIAIAPEGLDKSLLKGRFNTRVKRNEWLYYDEILLPAPPEPIKIDVDIAPYDELIDMRPDNV